MVLWEIGLKFVAVFKKKSVFAAPSSELYFLKMQIGKKCKLVKNSAWRSADI